MIALLLFSGAVAAGTPVPVLLRAVERGAILSATDFEVQPRDAARATGALSPDAAAGRETVRALPAGAIVRAGDAVAARLVRRGEPVTIVWKSAGLTITTAGRALTSGAQGEGVRVVAEATNRTLDGIVDGVGTVRLP